VCILRLCRLGGELRAHAHRRSSDTRVRQTLTVCVAYHRIGHHGSAGNASDCVGGWWSMRVDVLVGAYDVISGLLDMLLDCTIADIALVVASCIGVLFDLFDLTKYNNASQQTVSNLARSLSLCMWLPSFDRIYATHNRHSVDRPKGSFQQQTWVHWWVDLLWSH
jgi:hypothetical protein